MPIERTISVSTRLSATGEYINIPLTYSISSENGDNNVLLIHCRVEMPEEQIPEWLFPRTFVIRQVSLQSDPAVTLTELNSIPCANSDSAGFVSSSHDQIRLIEKYGKP